nr:type I-C CRISPR-associated protein Cas8c/Csd1 [Treponema sp.]
MSWITELSKVYDNTIRNDVGEDGNGRPIPMFHTANNASVTILLDESGSFIKADSVDKKDRVTIMPCTESCAARTSGADAYPLCDKLEYVAGNSAKHDMYLALLRAWSESEFAGEKIKAVYKYILSGTLEQDLQDCGIKLEDVKDFIRWEVQIPGDAHPHLWKDESVQKCWIDFYNSPLFEEYVRANFSAKDQQKRIRTTSLNYVDGTHAKIAAYHPAKIRNAGSSAKIISSNDTSNFTFRGRFLTDSEACQISSEATQKAHSALRWLIKKQGVAVGDGLSVVVWNQAGDDFPPLTAGSSDLLPVKSGTADENQKDEDDVLFDFGFDEPEKEEPQGIYSTSSEFASAMNKRLLGYYGDISKPQNIMVMAIKEATPGQGRASIILYRELQNSDMLKALESWHNRLSWYLSYWEKKSEKGGKSKIVHTIGTPSPKTIAECAYGERVKANLVEKTVQRILPCILDGGVIPSDLETQCVRSASNLLAVESYRRDIVLETACAVYKYNHHKEDFKLALEENRTSRDYLFGRLLAVEQQYENAALRKAGQERETNAVRYMQQFSMHPSKTWLMLYKDKLPAYRRHLEPRFVNWFEKQIQDISALFKDDDYMNDKPLSGEFLLGYQCQLKAFRKNTDDSSEENTEE